MRERGLEMIENPSEVWKPYELYNTVRILPESSVEIKWLLGKLGHTISYVQPGVLGEPIDSLKQACYEIHTDPWKHEKVPQIFIVMPVMGKGPVIKGPPDDQDITKYSPEVGIIGTEMKMKYNQISSVYQSIHLVKKQIFSAETVHLQMRDGRFLLHQQNLDTVPAVLCIVFVGSGLVCTVEGNPYTVVAGINIYA